MENTENGFNELREKNRNMSTLIKQKEEIEANLIQEKFKEKIQLDLEKQSFNAKIMADTDMISK